MSDPPYRRTVPYSTPQPRRAQLNIKATTDILDALKNHPDFEPLRVGYSSGVSALARRLLCRALGLDKHGRYPLGSDGDKAKRAKSKGKKKHS